MARSTGPFCGARKRQAPFDTCTRPAGWGTEHLGTGTCKLHGGRTPSANKSAAMKQAAALAHANALPVTNPLEALSELAGECLSLKQVFAERAGILTAEQWRYEGKSGEQIRGEILLLERAMDRAARILVDIARLNIDDRLARISEAQGRKLAAIISLVLDRLNLPADRTVVLQAIAEEIGQ